jgi:phosphatidate cytidylyltransferase
MKTRAITGIFFVLTMLASVLTGDYVFTFFLMALSLTCLYEFYRLVSSEIIKPQRASGIVLGFTIYSSVSFYFLKGEEWRNTFLIVVPLAVLVFLVELYRKSQAPFHNIAYTFLGIIFAVIPFNFFHAIGFLEGEYNFHFPMAFLLMLWAFDTGAYLFGIKFGKTLLFERHSPKKSWEGLLGGMGISLLVSLIISRFYTELPALHWAVISVIIGVSGTYGDLTESMLKRNMNKKDSGSLLPGHGGLLDRFDGLLLSAPLVFIYLYFVLPD